MKKFHFIFLSLIFSILSFVFLFNLSSAQTPKSNHPDSQENYICAIYFTGIGCPHCAKTDPFIFEKLLKEYPNLIIIEYEVYQQRENASLIQKYNENYNSGQGIPLIIFNKEKHIAGDKPIINNIRGIIEKSKTNSCPLINGNTENFENLNLADLPGLPKIWTKNRILTKTNEENKWILAWNGKSTEKQNSEEINPNKTLQDLVAAKDIPDVINKIHYTSLEPVRIPLSGKYISFDNAVTFKAKSQKNNSSEVKTKFTLPKILSLAAVDAINPCALAVLTLMLITILTYNPREKKNVILAGLAFTASVFIMYLIYGLIIVKSFQLIQALTPIKLWLYKILGIGAILLGILNIKDFIRYKPGGFLTEMPLVLRPKVKKIISGITSPKGAFLVGIFVTIFLLPCTIGPYVIAGGILCALDFLKIIPCLLLYNLIFILPMAAITLIVYLGITKIEDISGWKEKNIRYLHLITGLITLGLGIAMVSGLI